MSGATEIGSPRPRPLSGGFWTLLSWLRREEHLSSNESLSSAGSDRTVASFDFLSPAHYHRAAPVVVPPPGPPTDTYKQRVRERNLRRQHDRGVTLHRKYGLYRGDGLPGYDASTLPSSRQGITERQERERRATSECYQRRAAHVPGKRRAPLPPVRGYPRCNSLEPTGSNINRRGTRKRPAPQPPGKPINKVKENVIQTNNTKINGESSHEGREPVGHHDNISIGCIPEKYIKKDTKEGKIKSEKSFLKQIFDNKKRNSYIDITTVKVLPSISELDAQAAEIIENNNKLKNTEAKNHQTIIQAVKENYCIKCFKKPCVCKIDTMSSINGQSRSRNASTYTQTENSSRKIYASEKTKIDEKQKLKEMLKEMKDSLPKKNKQGNEVKSTNNIQLRTEARPDTAAKNMLLMDAPTLRIGSNSKNKVNKNSNLVASSQSPPISHQQKDHLSNVTIKQETQNVIVSNKTNDILQTTVPDGNILRIDNNNELKKINMPLKISSLLNPIYIPKVANSSQNPPKNDAPEVTTPVTSDRTKLDTAKAVRDIVLNSALIRNAIPTPSQPLKGTEQNNKSFTSNPSGDLKSPNPTIVTREDRKDHSNVERLSQHLKRRELVSMLEQSIAKGDQRAAAEAAAKLAQLRLSCSVLSFTSQILSEPSQPSTSKTTTEQNIPQSAIKIMKNDIDTDKQNSTKPLNAAQPSTSESGVASKVGATIEETVKSQPEKQNVTKHINIAIESNASALPGSTSKQSSLGVNREAETRATIDVWIEDKEKARGPIKLQVRRSSSVGDLRRQAEQALGLPSRLQRWIVGRTLCTNDDTPLVSLAGPSLTAPFYLYLVESDTTSDAAKVKTDPELPNQAKTPKDVAVLSTNEPMKNSSEVYNELVKLERQALVPNAEEFECEICMEQCKPRDGVVLRECVHSFCKGCLSDVIRHCAEPAVLCPATGCPGELHEREIRALVSPEEYQRWLARGLAAAESGTRNAFHCRTRDCTGWALCEVGVRRFPCPVCKHTNCVPCQAIHENQTCEQHRTLMVAAAATNTVGETDAGTKALIDSLIARGEALQCPECSAIITKKWGCDWVKCSACKTEICWVTRGRRWGPAGRGDTSGGCRCGVDGKRCHPTCSYCH